MKLRPINRKDYNHFILNWLEKGGYQISEDMITRIFDIGEDVPYNIQRLCNAMWESALETQIIPPELIERLPNWIHDIRS